MSSNLTTNLIPTLKRNVVDIDEKNVSFHSFRLCKQCNHMRPPRAHHCRVCGECVMRMDHHCPWAGNCIGLKNHKYFICFLFWTILACFHVFISSYLMNKHIGIESTAEDMEYYESFTFTNPLIAWVINLGVIFGVGVLLCMHLGFLDRNETTIESDKLSRNNPYNMKRSDNFEQIMGRKHKSSRYIGCFANYLPFEASPTFTTNDGQSHKNSNYVNGLTYPRIKNDMPLIKKYEILQ